jgi:hypothetical protein
VVAAFPVAHAVAFDPFPDRVRTVPVVAVMVG